jgi:acetyl-CoA C-acetyltransferase
VTSVEKAACLHIPTDGWVVPYAGTDAHDTYLIGERAEFHSSPAIRIAGARVLELSAMGVDDIDLVDVYSSFLRRSRSPPVNSGCRSGMPTARLR